MGPAGGLSALIEQTLSGVELVAVAGLGRDRPEAVSVMTALGQAFMLVVWGLIGGRCWLGVSGWGCLRMPLSGAGFGWMGSR